MQTPLLAAQSRKALSLSTAMPFSPYTPATAFIASRPSGEQALSLLPLKLAGCAGAQVEGRRAAGRQPGVFAFSRLYVSNALLGYSAFHLRWLLRSAPLAGVTSLQSW